MSKKEKMMKINYGVVGLIAAFGLILAVTFLPNALAVEPFGASLSAGTPQRAPADSPANDSRAFAGNLTEMMVSGYSVTQTWQGYFGNISGTIQLADASDQVLYNWTNANIEGEIYASMNSTLAWGNIQCFNYTANATGLAGAAGTTNLAGVNLSVLESQFGLASDDIDGVNETFTLTDHDAFFTANQQFSANECRSTRLYSNGGQAVDQQFEEVLLYEPTTGSVVFTSLIEETGASGYNGGTHDFEMLVLEDGHGTNVLATTYNFFVEIE